MSAAVGVANTTVLSDHDLMVSSSFGQEDSLDKSQPVLSRDAPTNTFALCRSLASSGGELHEKFDAQRLAVGTGVPLYPAHVSITLWAAENSVVLQIQPLSPEVPCHQPCAGAS